MRSDLPTRCHDCSTQRELGREGVAENKQGKPGIMRNSPCFLARAIPSKINKRGESQAHESLPAVAKFAAILSEVR
jgi:hypothetical protein